MFTGAHCSGPPALGEALGGVFYSACSVLTSTMPRAIYIFWMLLLTSIFPARRLVGWSCQEVARRTLRRCDQGLLGRCWRILMNAQVPDSRQGLHGCQDSGSLMFFCVEVA